jgi:class 3 adenylate cyclase/DNA-binding SARP family transcriptional activator
MLMIPGGSTDCFYPEFGAQIPIRPIVAAHEGAAAYTANRYARAVADLFLIRLERKPVSDAPFSCMEASMRFRPFQAGECKGQNEADIPRIQINVLGQFRLVRGDTPITEKEWSAAKKPQMLLKALITKGAENVPIDMIIDDLWPDSLFDDGRRNFKVVLHRLRKILGHPAGSLSAYISFEMNAISLNRKMVRVDIDEFLAFRKRAAEAEEAGDLKRAVDFGKSAIELYAGDYLEDELYTPWTMQKREETRSLYVDVLRRTASLYERQGNSRKAIELYKMLIKADPGCEEAYRKLMLLYSNIGMRTEAIRVYDECKRVLDRELDVDPDKLTTSLYERILENGRSTGGGKPLDFSRPSFYTPKSLAAKILTSRSSIEGERKIVTVMFANVANSPAVFADLDAEAVYDIMDGCFRLLLDEVHRFEGIINEFLGNGVMALFGAPIAHEDHAQRACLAALALRNTVASYAQGLKLRYGIDFKLRIGLNSGPVVVGSIGNDLRMDYTAQGDTVSLAEAMVNAAEPGGIMVTEHLCKLAREFFEFEPMGGIPMGGREESAGVFRLIKSTGVETRLAASVAKGLTRFVGRAREIKILNEAFDRAKSAEGRVVGIAGEAGVGKSRLLLEFKNSLPKRECYYLEGRCFHYGASMPYLPILDILRSVIGVQEGEQEHVIRERLEKRIIRLDRNLRNIIPPLQELLSVKVEDEAYAKLEPNRKREKTFGAIRDLLIRASRVRPIVLAIEDLHWVDRTTEELLDHMIGWISEAGILLILLYRNEYTHRWHNKSCYSEIKLGQLSTRKSTQLIAAILEGGNVAPELRELILDRSEGNPFFLEELTFAMLESGSIRREGKNFILSGDVSGMKVPDTIEGVLAARMDRLEESLKRIVQVAAVIGREFAFRILETISEMKEGLKAGLIDLQRWEFIYKKSIFPELEFIFRHALTREVAYNSLLLHKRREIHEQIGKAIEELYPGRLEEFYEMLAWHYSYSSNHEKAFRYLKLSGLKAVRSNSHLEAYHLFKRTLEVLGRMHQTTNNKRDRLEVLRLMANSMRPLGYPEGSIRFLREGEELAKELGDNLKAANFSSCIGIYLGVAGGNPVLGKTYVERGLSSLEPMAEMGSISPLVYDLAFSCTGGGNFSHICEFVPEYIEKMERFGAQSETFGRPFTIYPVLQAALGMALGATGEFAAGECVLRHCSELARRIGDPLTLAMVECYYCGFHHFKGDGENMVCHCKAAAETSEKSQMFFMAGIAWAWAGYGYFFLEQPQKALDLLEKGLGSHIDRGVTMWLGCIHADLALVQWKLGNPGKALFHAKQGVNVSRANNEMHFAAKSEIYLGKILGAGDPGRFGEAREHIFRGIETADKLKLRPLSAEGRFYLGELSASSGRTKEAMDQLRRAEAMFLEMGMEYWLSRAQAALARL